MDKILTIVLIAFVGVVVAFAFSLILALPVMLLWNWLMPLIFGLTTLTFWQSFGVLMLCSLLFKSSSVSSPK